MDRRLALVAAVALGLDPTGGFGLPGFGEPALAASRDSSHITGVTEATLACTLAERCVVSSIGDQVETPQRGAGGFARVSWRILQPSSERPSARRVERAFLYRIDLSSARDGGLDGCVSSLAIERAAPAFRMDLDGDGNRSERGFFVGGAAGEIAPVAVRRVRRKIQFDFDPPICGGSRSTEFGFFSRRTPGTVSGVIGAADGSRAGIDLFGPKNAPEKTLVSAQIKPVKLSGKIPPGCGPDPLSDPHLLDCWLDAHPEVRDQVLWDMAGPGYNPESWKEWPEEMRQDVRDTFAASWSWEQSGFTTYLGPTVDEPPVNHEPLELEAGGRTTLTPEDAWALYSAQVGHSLAVEIFGWVPWSLTSLNDLDVYEVVGGTRWIMERADPPGDVYHSEYPGYVVFGHDSTPANASYVWSFLRDNDLIRPTQAETLERVLEWSGRLVHYLGNMKQKNLLNTWGYGGKPPVSRVIEGTMLQEDVGWGYWPDKEHFTAGCYGTTDFLRMVLRVVNIPVSRVNAGAHTMAYFPTLHAYLSHSDDPYDPLSLPTSAFPRHLLLISEATWADWFLGDWVTANANVGRRSMELAVEFLTQGLVSAYCQDVLAGTDHENGLVGQKVAAAYSVAELEAMDIYSKLDAKAQVSADVSPCAALP